MKLLTRLLLAGIVLITPTAAYAMSAAISDMAHLIVFGMRWNIV